MRELRVEDALLYLDQVKVEFGDRPHIYNEFLEIMKTFKTQQIDTPGVIRRVSNLFKGNRRLVLGFNTFLPEGYQIELPSDGNGPPVAVYRAPGSNVAQILREGDTPQMQPVMQQKPPAQPPQQGHPSLVSHGQPQLHQPSHGHSSAMHQPHGQHHPRLPHAARLPRAGEAFAQNLAPQVMASHVPSQPMIQRDRQPHPLDQRAAERIRQNQGSTVPTAQQSPIAQAAGRDGKLPAAASLTDGVPTNGVGGAARQPKGTQQPQAAAVAGGSQPEGPMEFDHAINYVTTIKKRFATEPEIYKKFLEILHTYQKEQRGIKEVLDEVSKLFADHPDLLKEFTYFLPDAVQGQAKAQLDQVAKESEARKRAQAKQAILSTAHGMQKQAQNTSRSRQPEYDRNTVHVPYGAVQGRTEEQEQMIIRGAHFGVVSFDAVRPPRREDLTPSKAATKVCRPVTIPPIPKQPNTVEAAFLQKTKKHLERRELRSDKPTGSRRHTPYVEFLKCLHLFGAGVLSRDELIMLLKSLFMYGHAPKSGTSSSTGMSSATTSDANDLIRDLEEIMVGRGQYAAQQSALKDKSKYGSLRSFDFDSSNCENPTSSYFSYPSDYPHGLLISHPGQTKWDKQALNDVVVCTGKSNGERNIHSIEAYDGIAERHNAYEEAMMRIEEERYEIDMAIERNAQALRQIEPLAEEVQALKEQEEKDGQPIGRLQYRLNRHTLNSVHTNAIARLYGDRGDEVLQHLLRNPLAVLPIVYQRLKQKDAEWRKAKADLSAKLNASTAANYEGTLDTQCYFKRKALERLGTVSRLRDECTRARSHARKGEKQKKSTTVFNFLPNYASAHPDSQALLFQSYTSVKSQLDISHRDVFSLVSKRIQLDSNLSAIHRERVGRIWAEFVVPWFDYPAFWVADELRNSFSGSLSPNVVKFAPGQRVVTIYGEGTIVALVKTNDDTAPKYRVKLPYGYGFLNPAAILFAVASPDTPFVRRDGVMVRDDAIVTELTSEGQLNDRYKLVFGTENVYVFLRQFSLLCSLLRDTRQCCEKTSSPVDPSTMYHDPFKRDENIDPSPSRLDFSCIVDGLKKVVAGNMGAKELEATARKVSKETVHQVAAIPKLVERCAAALIETAKEDAILHLYDYCHLPRIDPASARAHCFAVAANASYRIQYDKMSGEMYFCYVPKGTALLTSLPDDIKSQSEDEHMSDVENGVSPMDDDEEDDPIEEYDDEQPAWKRLKVR